MALRTSIVNGNVCCIVLLLSSVVTAWPKQPQDPVVGIFSAPLEECPPVPTGFQDRLPDWARNGTINACVFSYGVRLLESVGARAVVFPWNLTTQQQRLLVASVNGIWIPGGGLWGRVHDEYKAAINSLYRIAEELNAQGDPFVLWGTCYGFELLMEAAAEAAVIEGNYTGMEPLMMALNFTVYQPTSRLWGNKTCPAEIRRIVTQENSTLNWHQRGLPPKAFDTHPLLRQRFVPLSWTTEPSGKKEFISSVEATQGHEIYGVQFHPERPPFEFMFDEIGHTPDDIAVSSYMANFIVSRLRRNNHTFATPQDAEHHRVAQWPLLDIGWGVETYFVVDP